MLVPSIGLGVATAMTMLRLIDALYLPASARLAIEILYLTLQAGGLCECHFESQERHVVLCTRRHLYEVSVT
jgi:hypothetical protein